VPLVGVCGEEELRSLLVQHEQQEWAGIRCLGLLLLIDWFCRPKQFKDNGRKPGAKDVSCSAEMARQYASPIKHPKRPRTIPEPLAVLRAIGILHQTAKAVFAHVKASARYAIAPEFKARQRSITVALPPLMKAKLHQADARCDKRLNRKHPFRKQLLADLPKLAFAESARPILAQMRRADRGGGGLPRIVDAIDLQTHTMTVNTLGTINTSVSSLPRELKPHLTLCGEVTAVCDVSHAHHCFLPRFLHGRLRHFKERYPGAVVCHLQAEHGRLIDFLSTGDYYRKWCENPEDDEERLEKKKLITTLLNMRNEVCAPIPLYRTMRSLFPHVFAVIEDIKRGDHRSLSKQLHRFTSDAINGALLAVQHLGLPAIPDTDAIICRHSDRERVCQTIGAHVYEVSGGVRCKVDGERYSPDAL